jgi:adenylylsulfate kinase
MAFVLWMTGLPCSGKTSIARALQLKIPNLALLDGDELREWLSPKDFTREGRNEHNRKVAYLARLLAKHNVPVCVSLISPFRENRETARKIIGRNFVEVYVRCPLDICESRDVKGMYKKARKNEISNFTGVSDPYEAPDAPELIVDTESQTVEKSTVAVLDYLYTSKLLPLAITESAA